MIRHQKTRRGLDPRASDGFTLVEMMIALVVLAVGILGVGRLFIFSQHHAAYGREETQAVSLAEEIREKILSDNFDDLITIYDEVDTDNPSSITTPCQIWANHLADGLGGVSGRGQIQVYDESEDSEIVEGMRTIHITISWMEGGKDMAAEMRFSVSKMGI